MISGTATIVSLNDEMVVLSVFAEGIRDDNVVIINKGQGARPELFTQIAEGRKVGDVVRVKVEVYPPRTTTLTHLGVVDVSFEPDESLQGHEPGNRHQPRDAVQAARRYRKDLGVPENPKRWT